MTARKRVSAPPAPAQSASPTYGTGERSTITPQEALLREIDRTNAAIDWLQIQIHALTSDQLIRGTRSVKRIEDASGVRTVTEAGSTRHELLALFIEERRHLHALCRDALSMRGPDSTSGGWPRAS